MYFYSNVTFRSNALQGCGSLISLYLLGSAVATLQNSNALGVTPMLEIIVEGKTPHIFVPEVLLSSYQTATNWTYYSSRFAGLTDEEIADLQGDES